MFHKLLSTVILAILFLGQAAVPGALASDIVCKTSEVIIISPPSSCADTPDAGLPIRRADLLQISDVPPTSDRLLRDFLSQVDAGLSLQIRNHGWTSVLARISDLGL
ncbi:hypothetical protein B0H13DRAFT_2649472 [Mycena leptocephala]|nr:hypothetical protein B0H13DRAFT_2649472 [Mycena leptocephala]